MKSGRVCKAIFSIFGVSLLLFIFAAQEVLAVTSVSVVVPGTSDPWLAGMPNGSTARGSDVAPTQSPVEVLGLSLVPGTGLTFGVTGSVNNFQGPSGLGPDGGGIFSHTAGAENGIANVTAPINSLVGIFLGADQPDLTAAPGGLIFNTTASRDFTTLSPLIKQPFFIGDGLTSVSVVQTVAVPTNATRLFLGTMDGFAWFNNSGQFDVQVSEPDTNTNPGGFIPVSITPPTELTLNGLDINAGFFTIEEIMVFDIDLNATNIPVPDPILAQIGGTDPHFLFNAPDGTKVINIAGFFDPQDPDLDPARFNYTLGSIKDDVSNLGFTAFLPSDTDTFAFQWTDLGATDSLGDNINLFSSTNPKDSLNLQGGDLSFDNGMDRVIFAMPDLIGDGSAGVAGQIAHGTIRGGNTDGGGGGGGGGGGNNSAVPEPITATLGLMGLGVLGIATRRRAV